MTLVTDNTDRFCSRCGLPLTDVASRECGVGPVCRKKDTHLYAKNIPANYPSATALGMGMTGDWFHREVRKTWALVQKRLQKIAARAMASAEDNSLFHVKGEDLRKIVTDLDLMCSYRHPNSQARSNLITMVNALGYVGLAAVLSGEASTSKSELWFENGRVFMKGLNNRSGWRAMGQIPGVVRPSSRTRKDPYSAPAAQAVPFINLVRRFWPLFEGSDTEITAKASEWAKAHASEAMAASTSTQAVNRFLAELRSEDFVCSFPWVRTGNMAGFLTALKTIPAQGRSYDPLTRKWSFRKEHLTAVLDMARKSGLFGIVDSIETSLTTPQGVYRSYQERLDAGRRQGQYSTWFTTRGRNWRP